MAGHLAIPGLGIYYASKWAVVGISETLKADLEPHNIGVSVLCPGVVATNIFSSGRNRPDDLGGENDSAPDVAPGDARLSEVLGGVLDPTALEEMVVHAIENDELYIFTHPEFKAVVGARYDAVNAAFDRWADYRRNMN